MPPVLKRSRGRPTRGPRPAPVDPSPVLVLPEEPLGFATPAEAARLLRVCAKTINNLCIAGEIPCVLIGKQRRIPWQALRKLHADALAKLK